MDFFLLPCSARNSSTLLRTATLMTVGAVLAFVLPNGSVAQNQPALSDSVTAAPDSLEGRRDALQAARAVKKTRLRPKKRSALERVFLWEEEKRPLQKLGIAGALNKQFLVGPTGLGSGAGFGLRVTYIPFPLRPARDARLSASGSVSGYWRLKGSIGYRQNAWFTHAYSQIDRRPQRTYYLELENTTGPDNSRRFDVTNWVSGGVLGLRLRPSLSVSASAAYLRYSSSVAHDVTQPLDPGILNPATSIQYATVGGHLRFDRRNVRDEGGLDNRYIPTADNLSDRPLNPTSGTLVSLGLTQFRELTGIDADFYQAEAEVQQYVSFFNDHHIFALRHRTVFTGPADATVPFYQLPYVGGDFTLRGEAAYRFRGPPHGLLYNLEYRYKVWHHADMAIFGDAGKVFEEVQQWGVSDLRYSYGVGLRFITERSALFRADVAFDENQTPRLIVKVGNVF